MALYTITVFLGAFLLLQIQPSIARSILPWFGGTAAVWSSCLLFFQVLLLAGYVYSHVSVTFLEGRFQALLHTALLLASLLLLPVFPSESWKPAGTEEPVFRILGLLVVTIGLPYFLLSTTGPLIQAWLVRTRPGVRPYRLFALANLAALLALLAYPVVVQPYLSISQQIRYWSLAYGVFVGLCGVTALRSLAGAATRPEAPPVPSGAAPAPRWLWIALSACPSVLLLAVTNHLTKDVAPVPFLWVLPLTLYLLSFVLCFEHDRWYRRSWYFKLLLVAFGVMIYGGSSVAPQIGLAALVALFAGAFFVCCMVCHGELARLKPHPQQLTSFYLTVAFGGALGGVFVGLAAPYLFRYQFELPLGLAGCLLLPALLLYRESPAQSRRQGRWLVAGVAAGLFVYLGVGAHLATQESRFVARNFFGTLRVQDLSDSGTARRQMVHGIVTHGEQFLDPARRRDPTMYFGRRSGAGLVFEHLAQRGPLRVGVVGLGAGVLASYGRRGDSYRFYEINPLVLQLARSEFTFLADSAASIDVVVGDGRLALEREPDQHFDVLTLDAFSGDSVPIHLLTKEAFGTYFRHLKPDGVLAVHVSNYYLDLYPVVAQSAQAWGKRVLPVFSEGEPDRGTCAAIWVLASGDSTRFQDAVFQRAAAASPPVRNIRLWTDDYSNLVQVVR